MSNKTEEQAELREVRNVFDELNLAFSDGSIITLTPRQEADYRAFLAKQKEKWEKEARLDGYTKGWRKAHKDMHDHIDWQSRSLVDAACANVAHLSSKGEKE